MRGPLPTYRTLVHARCIGGHAPAFTPPGVASDDPMSCPSDTGRFTEVADLDQVGPTPTVPPVEQIDGQQALQHRPEHTDPAGCCVADPPADSRTPAHHRRTTASRDTVDDAATLGRTTTP